MTTFTELMAQKNKPAPVTSNSLDEQFWAYCADGQLCFQRCNSCDNWRHLPRHMCAHCGSPDWRWEESSGLGFLYSWTVAHLPMHPAFAKDVPYAVAIVEMNEGVRMVARLRDIEFENLVLGIELQLSFDDVTSEPLLPYFKPRLA
tara:strand:- start:1143 stop:1580 length:438 start_codon:yes stop_codon:yes gene_type:complete